jgi:hypothetical protein
LRLVEEARQRRVSRNYVCVHVAVAEHARAYIQGGNACTENVSSACVADHMWARGGGGGGGLRGCSLNAPGVAAGGVERWIEARASEYPHRAWCT